MTHLKTRCLFLAILLAASTALATAGAAAAQIVIPDGTEVRLRLVSRVSSADARVDDTIHLEAVEDVIVGGVVVIAKGAEGRGTVLRAERRKSFGRKGKLDFSIDCVKTVDGQNVRLRYVGVVRGEGRDATAGVGT